MLRKGNVFTHVCQEFSPGGGQTATAVRILLECILVKKDKFAFI